MKDVPKIEFGPIINQGVMHLVPYLPDESGRKRIMKGHSVNADCCYTQIIKTPAGQVLVTHSVIH